MKTKLIIHPLLFTLFPVLALLSTNIHQLEIIETIRSFVVAIVIALVILSISCLLFRDLNKAALITSFALIIFFSYGHIYDSLKIWFPQYAYLLRHRYLLPILGLFFFTWFFYVWKLLKSPVSLNQAANVMAFVLFVLPLSTVIKEKISTFSVLHNENPSTQPLIREFEIEAGNEFPDIYYIILDGYGRSDVLSDLYQCDNSNFIADLRRFDFYIATQSTSNYNQTALSLASSLNMEYINYLAQVIGETSGGFNVPIEMLRHSEVRRIMKELGYDFVSFASNYYATEISDADYYWTSGGQPVVSETHVLLYGWSLNNFESLLATTTIARALIDLNLTDQNLFRDQIVNYQYVRHVDAIYHTLFSLDEIADLDGRFFTFAHILTPHPPFVFDRNGDHIIPKRPYSINDGSHFEGSEEEYIHGYCSQMIYINKLLLVTIDRILAKSDPEPIIIIQGDHGPGAYLDWDSLENSNLLERMGILNAYHVPETIEGFLYPSITPVNSFRVIFKHYFDFNLELTDDLNYFSSKVFPYKFYDVTEKVQSP